MNKKYYAVKNGRKIGVFETWDECKSQVQGYKGAIYKSFKTYDEAKNFIIGEENTKKTSDALKSNEIIAYVDGSYNIKTEKFGYGAILFDNEIKLEFKDSFYDEELKNQRNVAGEIYGAIKAIKEAIKLEKHTIYLHFDYMGIRAWALGEWKTNIELTKNYKKFIDSINDKIQIKFIKVKAHSNDKYNDIADRLAKEAVGI